MSHSIEEIGYNVVVAQKVGVMCKSCGGAIEIEDEYVPGIRATEMAAVLYAGFHKAVGGKSADVNTTWCKILTCGKLDCGKMYEYGCDDLLLFDD